MASTLDLAGGYDHPTFQTVRPSNSLGRHANAGSVDIFSAAPPPPARARNALGIHPSAGQFAGFGQTGENILSALNRAHDMLLFGADDTAAAGAAGGAAKKLAMPRSARGGHGHNAAESQLTSLGGEYPEPLPVGHASGKGKGPTPPRPR